MKPIHVRSPLESLYQFGDKVNKVISKSKKIGKKKIISIGNITTGGTGKTPASVYFARLLQQMGVKVAILTRGYGGTIYKEGSVLSDGENLLLSEVESGDEPYLLAKNLPGVPIAVGRKRYKNGLMVDKKFDPDIYLLDDGFQHYGLHRDLDIVLIDAVNPFGNGHILPHGTLREHPGALSRSDIVIITKSDLIEVDEKKKLHDKLTQLSGHNRIFESAHSPSKLIHLPVDYVNTDSSTWTTESLQLIKGSEIWGISGIGNHRAFERSLLKLGARKVNNISYRDHHRYTQKDVESLVKRIGEKDIVITTEKDWIRMQYFSELFAKLKRLYYVQIEFTIEENEDQLMDIIRGLT